MKTTRVFRGIWREKEKCHSEKKVFSEKFFGVIWDPPQENKSGKKKFWFKSHGRVGGLAPLGLFLGLCAGASPPS
jgi:hypothetical protein